MIAVISGRFLCFSCELTKSKVFYINTLLYETSILHLLCRCNVFLPFSLSVCSVQPRHSAAENRILRCCCVSFGFFRVRFSARIFFAGQKSLGLFFILTQIADIIKLYSVVHFMPQRRTRRRAKPLRCCQRNQTAAANAFFGGCRQKWFPLDILQFVYFVCIFPKGVF